MMTKRSGTNLLRKSDSHKDSMAWQLIDIPGATSRRTLGA